MAQSSDPIVQIDPTVTFQTIDGFGCSSRVFEDPHLFNNFDANTGNALTVMTPAQQDTILQKLYVDLGLTRTRPVIDGWKLEPVNDNSDPNVADPSKWNFAGRKCDAHIDYIKSLLPKGLQTFLLSPIGIETDTSTQTKTWITDSTPEEAAEWAFMLVQEWKNKGAELPYFNIVNEPGYKRSGIWSGAFLRDVIKILGPKMRAAGINTMIILPDDLNPSEAYKRSSVVLADSATRPYIAAIATHLYDVPLSTMGPLQILAKSYNLPIWMTEYSKMALKSDAFGWGELMHELLATYDVTAIDYMWGFFGSAYGAELIALKTNSDASYAGYVLNKVYYVTGQFSRFVKPGAQRIKVTSPDALVKVSAFKDAGKMIVVVQNRDTTITKQIQIDTGTAGSVAESTVRTSSSQNWATLANPVESAGTFTVSLPPQSVTTYIFKVVGVAAPTNLGVNASSSSTATLTWLDKSNNEIGFAVERQTGSTSFTQIATLSANTSTYTDNVAYGTTYTYRVKALGADGTSSDYSNEAAFYLPLVMNGLLKAGDKHSVALDDNGVVWTWGQNNMGQLGIGSTNNTTVATAVTGVTNLTEIAAGTLHTLAIRSDGTVWSWGSNNSGRLGDGTTLTRTAPVQVRLTPHASSIAAGSAYSLAVAEDGTVWAWGNNSAGQLGDGTLKQKLLPVKVQNLTNITAVTCGTQHSLALRSDGTVWSWGDNTSGQLGIGSTTSSLVPTRVPGLSNIVEIAAGHGHSLALASDGTVWAWGSNAYGQLGNGTVTSQLIPTKVPSLGAVTSISAGYRHSVALAIDGSVWSWGRNVEGQLGDGSITQRNAPVRSSAASGVLAISAGTFHTLALFEDGSVEATGSNLQGQLGVDSPTHCKIFIRTNTIDLLK